MNTAYQILLAAQLAVTPDGRRNNRDAAEIAIRALVLGGLTIIREAETWVEFGHQDGPLVVKHGRRISAHCPPDVPVLVRTCVAGDWRPTPG